METIDIKTKGNERRSRKVKDLEREVEMILAQDDFENGLLMRQPQTPSTLANEELQKSRQDAATSRALEITAMNDLMQTPRRSCRKSVKPAQDYEDIVKSSLGLVRKSVKKSLLILHNENNEENIEDVQGKDDSQRKWTPTMEGQSSTKRGRKSKKNVSTATANKNKENVVDGEEKESLENVEIKSKGSREFNREISFANTHQTIVTETSTTVLMDVKDDRKPDNAMKVIEKVDTLSFATDIAIDWPLEQKEIKDEEKKTDYFTGKMEDIGQQKKIEDSNDFQQVVDESEVHKVRELNQENTVLCINKAMKESQSHVESACLADEKAIQLNDEDHKKLSSDSFGSYLKSNKICVSDLGLIPLKDDVDFENTGENIAISKVGQHDDAEEMPSLIILDDDEQEEENNDMKKYDTEVTAHEPKLNVTFETIEDVNKDTLQKSRASIQDYDVVDNSLQMFLHYEASARLCDEEMDSLKMSDDDETPRKLARINPATPKQKPKPDRFPTPHSNKFPNRENSSSSKNIPQPKRKGLPYISMEPKEIVLRGIRKRSISICLLGSSTYDVDSSASKRTRALKSPLVTHTRQKAVKFYSPANQTAIINNLDRVIENSERKEETKRPVHQIANVTTRRKRSLSVDESMMLKTLPSKLPRPEAANCFSKSTSTLISSLSSSSASKRTRTKLPNFSAIHQKQFQNMENLVDHVKRKQERSKILISSTSKIKQASAHKNVFLNERSGGNEPSKALKKINFEELSEVKSKQKHKLTTKPIAKSGNGSQKFEFMKENQSMIGASNLPYPRDLPNPKFIKFTNCQPQNIININKSHSKSPAQATNVMATKDCSSKTTLKASQAQKPFNLSTHISNKPQLLQTATTSKATQLSSQDKMASRLQRHIELFKGRAPTTRSGTASRKMESNIKGVRSNRRFELQMLHRKNLEK